MPMPLVIADGPLDPVVQQLLHGQVEFLPWQAATSGETSPAQALYTYGHPHVDGAMLDRLPALKVISNYGVGVDHIDLPAAQARGIPVANTPGVLDGSTADMAFTLLLAAARRLVEGDRYARSADFTSYDPGYMLGVEVHGQTLGIVGMGRIGCEVARRARGFNMRVLYCNRKERGEAAELSATRVPLDDLLSGSDFVVLTVPLSDQTRGLIGRQQLQRMKQTSILVNVARGPVVDTQALTEALQQRWIYGAAVDVTDPEPLP